MASLSGHRRVVHEQGELLRPIAWSRFVTARPMSVIPRRSMIGVAASSSSRAAPAMARASSVAQRSVRDLAAFV